MSFDFFLLLLFLLSLINIIFFIFRKIPVIADLPLDKDSIEGYNNLEQRGFNVFVFFKKIYQNPLIFLQKILSKIMIFILKLERIIWGWLQKIREKSKKRITTDQLSKDDYWEKLKGSSNEVKKDK
jgi:hypothetical protein